jgi:quercetin dioxygenase-like cupin family protein
MQKLCVEAQARELLAQAAAGADAWEGRDGDLLVVPDAPHSLVALADSAVLLSVAKRR